MNCRQANRLLPLWVGRDLADAAESEALRVHLTECPDCSSKQHRLQRSLDALQSISTTSQGSGIQTSLWPRLARVLKDVPRRRDQFNGWIPAAAMTLAATLMVAVSLVQVRRDMGNSIQARSVQSSRNLFESDQQFAPGADGNRGLRIPVVAQPVNYQRAPSF